jgi:hypothetical protein
VAAPQELAADPEWSAVAVLAEEVQRLAVAAEDNGVLLDDVFTDEVFASFGIVPDRTMIQCESPDAPGLVFSRCSVRNAVIAAADALLTTHRAEQDGAQEQADRFRGFALVALRDARRGGPASPELIERLGDSDGIMFDPDPGYDAMCDEAGGVELIEAAVYRPARRTDTQRRLPPALKRLRRSRPREHRRSASRRSSRAGPARPRPSEDGEADPPLALGAAA